jgi:hypothetical protein
MHSVVSAVSGNAAGNKFLEVLSMLSSHISEYVQVIQNGNFPNIKHKEATWDQIR